MPATTARPARPARMPATTAPTARLLEPTGPLPLIAEGVGFTYRGAGRSALAGVDFQVPAGSVLLVVGPSGSGKSTLARAIAGLVPQDIPGAWSGSLRVGGLEVSSADRARIAAHVGLLFQDPGSQLVMDRAADDVAFGLENRAWSLAAMRVAVPAALAETGLAGFDRRRGSRLSGGEQQRLALAGVMAPMPGVLVLDEPTANLDPVGAAALFGRLAKIKESGLQTIVLVEHRADLAWPLADLVLALDSSGAPIDLASPREILARSREQLAGAGIWLPAFAEASDKSPGAPARKRGRSATGGATESPTEGAAGSLTGGATESPTEGATGSPLVVATDVRYAYAPGAPVVRDVNLAIDAGERVAVVGPNGGGKSTLLRLIAGLLRADGGAVRIGGRDPARLRPAELATVIGYVFQDPDLGFIEDTVAAEVPVRPDGGAGSTALLMKRLGLPLDVFGARNPYRLSGGEQRRLSLATALARRPRLLILDEPTFGQDRRGWEAIAGSIEELVGTGTAVLVATHDEAFATRIANRRIEMADGWIVADDRYPGGLPGRQSGGS
ncbi:MAG: ABC transporter ATP-binding protein [Chloroflexi bacterium]|nr:ABC transporter ATP-binding protein [Chloroflexota bacterium]